MSILRCVGQTADGRPVFAGVQAALNAPIEPISTDILKSFQKKST
jgi:hypothetical protein